MRKGRVYLILIAGLVCVGVIVVVFIRSGEPAYAGRSLSSWIEQLADPWSKGEPAAQRDEAARAVLQIGSNGVSCLLKYMLYETPGWKTNLYGRMNPFLLNVNSSWRLSDSKEWVRVLGARRALATLGLAAESAIPELIGVLKDTNRIGLRPRTAWVLGHLGKSAVPPVLSLVRNRQLPPSFAGSMFDPSQAGNIPSAIPALVDALKDPDSNVRAFVTNALGSLDPEALDEPGIK